MEIQIPDKAYNGPPTPFGGPSLEWIFDNIRFSPEESEDARLSSRGVPESIVASVTHLRRILPYDFPKNSANVQRKILCCGVPIVEDIVRKYPKRVESMERLYFKSGDDDLRTYLMKNTSVYQVNLGPVDKGQYTVFTKNKEQASRIRNLSEDLGLPVSRLVVLCLTAGLAQSTEESWVPTTWRQRFIKEIRFFDQWLSGMYI